MAYVLTVIVSAYIYNRQKRSRNSIVEDVQQAQGKSTVTCSLNASIPNTCRGRVMKLKLQGTRYFAEEYHSSDSSDDEVPLLSDGTIQHDYGESTTSLEATV